ncbi:transposase, partial [Deinococcus saxicola]|uniref:transposase n=2 Tax=Deinococcus saxicola TaxID=249406 RepID=UPI0039F02246
CDSLIGYLALLNSTNLRFRPRLTNARTKVRGLYQRFGTIKTFKGHREFVVIKKRWIVERSFAWCSFDRRLNREYDLLAETTEALILLSFIRRMIRQLAAFAAQIAVAA